MVDLVAGDPARWRASFARFVLPFQWRPGRVLPPGQAGPRFTRASAPRDWLSAAGAESFDRPHLDAQRRRYLTAETRSLLFDSAAWFILRDGDDPSLWRRFRVESDVSIDGTLEGARVGYEVALRPPALVLFEAHEPAAGDNDGIALLRNGFLIHEAWFPDGAPRYVDFLRFNEIFRYWRFPYPEHESLHARSEIQGIAAGIRGDQAPPPGATPYSAAWQDLLQLPVELAGGRLIRIAESGPCGSLEPDWLVNPDDRAFTMPFAVVRPSLPGSYRIAPELSAAFDPAADPAAPRWPGFWVKLLNVDRPLPWGLNTLGDASRFECGWANERSYKRWVHDGSLYGFCEHAFAAMVPASLNEDGAPVDGDPPLALHFRAMYLDVTLLLLYLRVSVLRFGRELHEATRKALQTGSGIREEIHQWRERFHAIRWQFLLLENLYQFPHFSNQQQHLEMYDLQRKWMDIDTLYKEIDKEIRTSDEFVDNQLNERRNEIAERSRALDQKRNEQDRQRNSLTAHLSGVATCGLAFALALGWMDAHADSQSGPVYFAALTTAAFFLLLATVPLAASLSTYAADILEDGRQRAVLFVVAVAFLVGIAALLPRYEPLERIFQANPPQPAAVCEPSPPEEPKVMPR